MLRVKRQLGLMLTTSLSLLVSATASQAQLFTYTNPFDCAVEAKHSTANETAVRQQLVACMRRIEKPTQGVRALRAVGVQVSYITEREIERAENSGNIEKAMNILTRLIEQGG